MLMYIILYLLQLCHQLYKQNCWLIQFICRYIPLKQWAFDDSHSPKYQKFKVDRLPKIVYHHHDWDLTAITHGDTVSLSDPYIADLNATSRMTAPAPPAKRPSRTSTATMVKQDS